MTTRMCIRTWDRGDGGDSRPHHGSSYRRNGNFWVTNSYISDCSYRRRAVNNAVIARLITPPMIGQRIENEEWEPKRMHKAGGSPPPPADIFGARVTPIVPCTHHQQRIRASRSLKSRGIVDHVLHFSVFGTTVSRAERCGWKFAVLARRRKP